MIDFLKAAWRPVLAFTLTGILGYTFMVGPIMAAFVEVVIPTLPSEYWTLFTAFGIAYTAGRTYEKKSGTA